ncbi:MAG: hypothetical protein V4489_01270 [Chlamydiota bacterium]
MNISFSKESFPKLKLFIGTPMHGGTCTSAYLRGMVDLSAACSAYNIGMTLYAPETDLVQKGRNLCVDAFLKSDSTHFLFIDADIGFTAKDALTLLYLVASDKEGKYDILAGPYPKKSISWEKVKRAVEKGFANENAKSLENYVGNYTFLAPLGKPFSLDAPAEVLEIGTGFMMIPKRTFEKFMQAYPQNLFRESKDNMQFAFFNCAIDPATERFMGEDSLFCLNVRKMGGKVWVAPWLRLIHQGTYSFQGSLAHIAAIGMSPADL